MVRRNPFDADVMTPQSAGYGVDLADLDGDGDLDLVTSAGGISAFLFTGHVDVVYGQTVAGVERVLGAAFKHAGAAA